MFRYKVNLAITILTLSCVFSVILLLQNVTIDQSPTLEQMLSDQDRHLIDYSRQLFGVESEPMILAILSPSSPVSAERLLKFESTLQAIDGVSNTFSSASLHLNGFNNKKIFSLNNTTELIYLLLKPGTLDMEASKNLSHKIRQSIDALLIADQSFSITGFQQIRAASWNMARQNLKMMLPLLVAITIIITLLFFRSFTALGLSLLLASLTTALCLAGHILLRAELNLLIILVIPVIWAIATLDAFHLYSRSAIKIAQNDPSPVETASKELLVPCLLTTVTTAACFLTLTFLDTSPLIITLGIWGAAGTLIAFILTFTVGKKLLATNRFHRPPALWPGCLSVKIVRFAQKHSKPVVIFWLACLCVSLFLVPRLQVSSPFPQVFTPSQAIASDINHLKALTDTDLNVLDIIIEVSDSPDRDIRNLISATLLTTSYLNTIEETRLVVPVDLIDVNDWKNLIDRSQSDERLQRTTVPDIAIMDNWINQEKQAVRLQVYMAETTYQRKQEIFNWLRHFDETMLGRHKITLSGSAYFYNLIEQQGLKSLLFSSLLCLMILIITMLWITRNYLQALIALSATIIPVLIVVACMVVLGVSWSIALLPLPAILLGLMADDTIHIIWFSRRVPQFSKDYFRHNARLAGPALLATTLVLSFAAATLTLSGLQSNQHLGILIPLALLIAFLCNLSLLPALNSWLHRSTR